MLTRTFALTDIGCTQISTTTCVFELDGNIVKDSPSSTTFPTDWGALFNSAGVVQPLLQGGGLDANWTNDGPHSVSDVTTFTTGSKDILDIANGGWQFSPSNNLTPKDDILHAYSYAIVPTFGTTKGDLLIYGARERLRTMVRAIRATGCSKIRTSAVRQPKGQHMSTCKAAWSPMWPTANGQSSVGQEAWPTCEDREHLTGHHS